MRRAFCTVLLFAVAVHAHPGGIDSQGGHNDRSAGTYHFHQGPLDGQSFDSKDEAANALQGDMTCPPGMFPSPKLG